MAGNNQNTVNYLRRKIEQCIRKNGFDEKFIQMCIFHLEKILLQFKPAEPKVQEIEIMMSNLFVSMMEHYPQKRFQCHINESYNWPIPLLPSEVFAKNIIPIESRKFVFYECLRIGDILDCRVSSNLPTEYQLRVIHKYGVTRILDDLNIIVAMRKADINVLPQYLKEFQLYALIRVVVTEREETKVFVSIIDNNTDLRVSRPQLGAISDRHLPEYVLNPYLCDKSNSFRDYLSTKRAFYDPLVFNGIFIGFGIDPCGNYSYYPIDNSLNSIDVIAQLNKIKLSDAHDLMQIALKENATGNLKKALDAINQAINISPKAVSKRDKTQLSKLYEIKGNLLTSENMPLMTQEALRLLADAVRTDKTNESAKVTFSKRIFRIAMKYYKQKDYLEAAEWASKSLKLNENANARGLMEHLKVRYPETIIDCGEISLLALLEKKKALGSELKKLSTEDIGPLVSY